MLCPTRELCLQITNELTKYAKQTPGLTVVSVYGGTDIQKQIRSIRKGAHIVVGTPGRLLDHIKRKTINLGTVQRVVLDEADEMLNMGFKDDIDTILKQTTNKKTTWLFSATMPTHVETLASRYMSEPIKVTVGSKNSSAQNITHTYCVVHHADRYRALNRFVDFYPNLFGIVFCRTRRETKEVVEKLTRDGYNADALHGDLSQPQRDTVMRKFRHKKISLLVATDVASRGIDVNDVTHIIHYGLPDDVENYTHRSGRTARAGKHGTSITIISNRDIRRIKFIERLINTKIEYIQVPNGESICKNQLHHCIDTITQATVDEKSIAPYMDTVLEKCTDLSKEDIIKRFVSLEFNRFVGQYKNAPDLNGDTTPTRYNAPRSPSSRRRSNSGFNRRPQGQGQRQGQGRRYGR